MAMVHSRGRRARPTVRHFVRKREGCDIGGAVRFLLSDQARYITGQVLVVRGGATLVGPSRASQ
jgi:NAD(P)-dependent dehydrogenase (short-subunit alcohol dehydrogenase family)